MQKKKFDIVQHPFMIKALQKVGIEGTCAVLSYSVMSDSLQPHGLYSPWNSPGQNTGMGSLSFLHGTFPTQGWNPGLLHCRQILYQLKGILQKSSVLNLINYQRPRLLSSIEVRISKFVWGVTNFQSSAL